MKMLCASGSPWWRLATLGLVIAGLSIPIQEGRASPAEASALLAGPGCGVPGGVQPTLRPGLVKAERKAGRKPSRPTAPTPTPTPELEVAEEDPPAILMHAFFTCASAASPARPVGQGWIAVGPVRRG